MKSISQLRPVYVIGIGLHPYQYMSETSYVELGLTAVRSALQDAGLKWPAIESVYHGTVLLGMAPTRIMLRHLGATGIPMTQVENASASGSSAFRQAVIDVASGMSDVSLALGVDKPDIPTFATTKTGIQSLDAGMVNPVTHFSLLANRYMYDYGATIEDFARVVVKNSGNAISNPNAQIRKKRTLEDITQQKRISGSITSRQCCPIGEGAAAVIVTSEEGLAKYGLDQARAVRVASSVLQSEGLYEDASNFDARLTAATTEAALDEAAIEVTELDVIELHDAFAVEELFYLEAMGLAHPGEAPQMLAAGHFNIGGQVAVSPSGGLLCMGHPLGPTGVGQIAEVTMQLRGEAGARQQPNAKKGLAHMVGIGAVCAVHVLAKD